MVNTLRELSIALALLMGLWLPGALRAAEDAALQASTNAEMGAGSTGAGAAAAEASAPVDANAATPATPPNSGEGDKAGAQAASPKATPPAEQNADPLAALAKGINAPVAESLGFGYNTFLSGSDPISDGPISDQYLVSPGDEIVVSIWGELVETFNLTVTDEGYVELPDQGGRIQTNGVSLKELKPKIVQGLSRIYAAFINAAEPAKSKAFVDVRLGKVQKLSIFVVGEVNRPGAYRISPGVANVINLLHNAGGVRNSGSLRDIKIRRNTGQTETVDLYGFFLTGDIDFRKSHLQPGDYVIVPLKQKSVSIEGEVLRPNTYELIGDEGMRELLAFAGGFTPDAYLKQSQIRRFEINRGEVYMDVDLDSFIKASPGQNLPLVNGDSVTIVKNVQIRKNSVTLKGDGVTRPGAYEWKPGMTLSDLIAKGEGLREYAYLDRADLIRTEDDFSKTLTVIALNDLYRRESNGLFSFTGNAEKNLALREMDEVIIQSAYGMAGKDQYVTMEGHVREPGRFILAKGMGLYDLVFARGGFQDAAFRKATFLDTAHIFRKVAGKIGKRIITFNLGALLDNDPNANLPLEEDDVIRIYSYADLANPQNVQIDGLIKKPGAFPMVENLTLEDLLVMAGGLQTGADFTQAVIARPDMGGVSRSIVVPVAKEYTSLPQDQRTVLESGDKVSIVGLAGKDRFVALEGHVQDPGQFILTKDMTLHDLIATRGGFQDPAFRKDTFLDTAHIFRKVAGTLGKQIIPFNLGALLDKNPEANLPLEEGDVVRIYAYDELAKAQIVHIDGLVKKPGEFPMAENLTLEDLLVMAGGLQPGASATQAVIARADVSGVSRSIVVPVAAEFTKLPRDQRTALESGDKVSIVGLAGKDRFVALEGHVQDPGQFILTKDMTLHDLIATRGGFQDPAFRKDTFLDTAHIFRKVAGTLGKQIIPFNLGALLDKNPEANLPLEEGDVVRIYAYDELAKAQIVHIDGLVKKPGEFPMAENLTLEDLLVMAGGLQPGASATQAVIARADVSGVSRSIVVPVAAEFTKLPRDQRTALESGDKVSIVGLAGKDRFVALEGHVQNPGQFTLTKDMTLHDLIATRGGFQDPAFRKDTFLDTAHIFRKVAGTLGKQIIPFNLGALLDNAPNANLPLEEDDSVRIYSHAEMRMPQQVTIDGLIKQPGAFSMTVDMTLEDLIMMAGGLSPDAYKVEAAIARSEKDSTVSELTDLQLTTIKVPVSVKGYATLPQDQKTLLKAGDRVTIRSLPGWEKSPTVLIQGEVIEPGNYSLITEPETLSSLVKRAGGLKKEALPEGVTVKRRKSVIDMADAQSSEYYDITVYLPAALENPGGADDLVLKGDDQIFIPTNPGVVEVRGAVNRPLTLQHKPGRTLAEYIALCGGYLDKADPGKVKVFAANKVALNARVAEVAKGKNNKGNMGSPSLLNVPPGSVIEVPFLRETERLLTVEVKGAVAKPALVQHIEGAPLGYYLNLSGGFTPEADIDDISVLLPNGGLLVKTGNQPFNPVVPGGSLIMVSTKTIKEAK